MTMLGNGAAEVEDPEGGSSAGPEPEPDGGLVLPEEVVAQLAAAAGGAGE